MTKSAKTLMLLAAAFTAGVGRPVLERKPNPEHFRSCYGGSGYHREALDAGELRRSRTAYSQTVRSWRVLLLEVATKARCISATSIAISHMAGSNQLDCLSFAADTVL